MQALPDTRRRPGTSNLCDRSSVPGRLRQPVLFVVGVLGILVGVLLHFGSFLAHRTLAAGGDLGALGSLAMTYGVAVGIPLNLAGLALSAWALLPGGSF